MRLNLVGNAFNCSGYANHFRGLFKALYDNEKVEEIKIHTNLVPGWEIQCTDSMLECIKKPWIKDGITIIIDMPHNWSQVRSLPCTKFVGYCVWEGTSVPSTWLKHLSDADHIIVPSNYVKEAILNTVKDYNNQNDN